MLRKPGPVNMALLEETGLDLRPELREAAYQEKIDRQDIYKEIIKMLPGIGVLGSLNYDSNRLLYNNTWGELGVRATYNLVSLIEGPKAISAAKTAVEVAKARRLALGVAVLTQINLGVQEYQNALDDLASADELSRIQRDLSDAARGGGCRGAARIGPCPARTRRHGRRIRARARPGGCLYGAGEPLSRDRRRSGVSGCRYHRPEQAHGGGHCRHRALDAWQPAARAYGNIRCGETRYSGCHWRRQGRATGDGGDQTGGGGAA
jgi:hypothetical protein